MVKNVKVIKDNLQLAVGLTTLLIIATWCISLFGKEAQLKVVEFCLYVLYTLLFTGTVGAIALSIYRMMFNKASFAKFLMMFGAVIVLFLVCYFSSTSDLATMPHSKFTSPGQLQFAGGIAVFTYVLLGSAAGLALLSEVYKMFK